MSPIRKAFTRATLNREIRSICRKLDNTEVFLSVVAISSLRYCPDTVRRENEPDEMETMMRHRLDALLEQKAALV